MHDPTVWIHQLPSEPAVTGPLAGKTFAVKDNIDVAHVPTTAGCPAYAYTPQEDNPVVGALRAAGAQVAGKTALDQFATGLVGTRSPWGPCANALNPKFISGGSSSGSAVAVARGEVDFALGTDTAGSGRVPCVLNGLVGYKPTLGILSTRGVVPACRTLDCVTLMARSVQEISPLLPLVRCIDSQDPFSRAYVPIRDGRGRGNFRFATPMPHQREFFGDAEAASLYEKALDRLRDLGGTEYQIDFTPFAEAAVLLYQGPWVAERYAAVGAWLEKNRDKADPTVAKIILGGRDLRAEDAFKAMYQLRALRAQTLPVWEQCDFLVVPTVPTVYTIEQVQADPITLNSRLGIYNNFVNLLDLAAVAVPTGHWASGVGFGVNLIAPAFADDSLLDLASRMLDEPLPPRITCPEGPIQLAVVGAHLRGQPLHGQLTQLGARFIEQTTTSPNYQLYALAETTPPKPGLVRAAEETNAIEIEVYELCAAAFGRFTAAVPPPLAIGNVELSSGKWIKGFVCEPAALKNATNITALGAWRAHLKK